ncbi:MAG: DUF4293 family protein [Cytophagales bacterium]|nr:MAG: DUF4293 family protein [Cytophagales bacterium]
MIQRIQSIFLILMVIALVVFIFVPIWSKTSADGNLVVTLNAFELTQTQKGVIVNTSPTILLLALAFGAAGLGVFSLFCYQNRLKQMMFGMINSVLIAALLGSIIYFSFQGDKLITDSAKGSYGIGLLVPAIALILNTIANKFIRKDEETVQASNRMR